MRALPSLIGLLAASATVAPTLAQARPDSLRMSCTAAAELVRRSGAVVIGTGPDLFDRYVVDRGYCAREQVSRPAWIETADQPQCLVGQRCVERPPRFRR